MPKVLIADKMSMRAQDVFSARGIEVDVKTGLSRDALIDMIGAYDGIAVRSATKLDKAVMDGAQKLKVIGRAGIGVDNIDLQAATAKGIVVMNTPFGNSVTTAEHTIALILALARQLPLANESTHAGKWEKNRFLGTEVTGKMLGVIGCGNIGSIVASRALGLSMQVITYDPFLSQERAADIGVGKVGLDELLAQADFITLHTPLTDKTRNIINKDSLAKTKKNVRIVNCARGELVVEKDLKDFLEKGHIAGAALDVFIEEPAKDNILFGMDHVICTPHLGAATSEAQDNVAVQVAEQIAEFFETGAVKNAINMPSISAEDAPRLRPYITLAKQLGLFAGQITDSAPKEVSIEYVGEVGELNFAPLTFACVAGLLKPFLQDVNMVNALSISKERGIYVAETKRASKGAYEGYIRLQVKTDRQTRAVAGCLFSDKKSRVIQVDGINMEAEFTPIMLYSKNRDEPGFIGQVGSLLGKHNINIASFNLGRDVKGGQAVCLIAVDDEITDEVIKELMGFRSIERVKRLHFQI